MWTLIFYTHPHFYRLFDVNVSQPDGYVESAGRTRNIQKSGPPTFSVNSHAINESAMTRHGLLENEAHHIAASERHSPKFVENKGQWDKEVRFRFGNGGSTLWLTNNRVVFDSLMPKREEHSAMQAENIPQPGPLASGSKATGFDRLVFSEDLVATNPASIVDGTSPQPGTFNYLGSNDPAKWRTGVRAYQEIIYHDLWAGIDLRVLATGADVEQEFVVHPGADLANVHVAYRGIDGLEIAKDGSLVVHTAFGELHESRPRIYQEIAGNRVSVQGRYKLLNATSYTFEVFNRNPQFAIVVDPTLLYSTFLGGSAGNNPYTRNQEVATGIAVDASGNAYVSGATASVDFPTTPGAFQLSPPSGSFVTKLNATGSVLVYSTFLGQTTYISAIAADSAGNAYVTGYTGTGFPTTPNAYLANMRSFRCVYLRVQRDWRSTSVLDLPKLPA
jgi:hypothetical protein